MNASEIRAARERAHLSRSALARLLDITPQAVERWETGKSKPSPANAARLTEVFASDDLEIESLSHLRDVVAAQALLLEVLLVDAIERTDADSPLARKLAAMLSARDFVLGRRPAP